MCLYAHVFGLITDAGSPCETYSVCRRLASFITTKPTSPFHQCLSIHHFSPLLFSFILPHPLLFSVISSTILFYSPSPWCLPLTFKPTSVFALYPSLPHLYSVLSLLISSIYLKFPSACPSACFTVLSIYLFLSLLLIFHFWVSPSLSAFPACSFDYYSSVVCLGFFPEFFPTIVALFPRLYSIHWFRSSEMVASWNSGYLYQNPNT